MKCKRCQKSFPHRTGSYCGGCQKPTPVPSRSSQTIMLDRGGRVIVGCKRGDSHNLTFIDGDSRHYWIVDGLTRENLVELARVLKEEGI